MLVMLAPNSWAQGIFLSETLNYQLEYMVCSLRKMIEHVKIQFFENKVHMVLVTCAKDKGYSSHDHCQSDVWRVGIDLFCHFPQGTEQRLPFICPTHRFSVLQQYSIQRHLKAQVLSTAVWGKGNHQGHAIDKSRILEKKRLGKKLHVGIRAFKASSAGWVGQMGNSRDHCALLPQKSHFFKYSSGCCWVFYFLIQEFF